jgi:hypothetical protein
MKIRGIKLSQLDQPLPIFDVKYASLKVHGLGRPKLLQRAVYRGYGHSKGFAYLDKTNRRSKCTVIG